LKHFIFLKENSAFKKGKCVKSRESFCGRMSLFNGLRRPQMTFSRKVFNTKNTVLSQYKSLLNYSNAVRSLCYLHRGGYVFIWVS